MPKSIKQPKVAGGYKSTARRSIIPTIFTLFLSLMLARQAAPYTQKPKPGASSAEVAAFKAEAKSATEDYASETTTSTTTIRISNSHVP